MCLNGHTSAIQLKHRFLSLASGGFHPLVLFLKHNHLQFTMGGKGKEQNSILIVILHSGMTAPVKCIGDTITGYILKLDHDLESITKPAALADYPQQRQLVHKLSLLLKLHMCDYNNHRIPTM